MAQQVSFFTSVAKNESRSAWSETDASIPAALAAISNANQPSSSSTTTLRDLSAAVSSPSALCHPHPLFPTLLEKGILTEIPTAEGTPRTCQAVSRPKDFTSEFQALRADTADLRDPSRSQIVRAWYYKAQNRYFDVQGADQWLFRLNDPHGMLDFEAWKTQVQDWDELGDCPYINASCMGSFHGDIITQGPLMTTKAAFWKMVWLARLPVIVMLTPFIESNIQKCDEYFHKRIGKEVSCGKQFQISVRLIEEIEHKGFIVRKCILKHGNEERLVEQVHCSDWTDHQAYAIKRLCGLIKYVAHVVDGKSLTAHCSAGVGRTGTFYACYLIYLFWKLKGGSIQVNVYELVKLLRSFRPDLVQRPPQYGVIFDFIDELNKFDSKLSSHL